MKIKARPISRHDDILSIVNSGKFIIDHDCGRASIFTNMYVWDDEKYYNLPQDDDESYDEMGNLLAKEIDPNDYMLSLVRSGDFMIDHESSGRAIIYTNMHLWDDGEYYDLSQDDDESYDDCDYQY